MSDPKPDRNGKSLLGAIVLCGGLSERMGYEKFKLRFDGKTFLQCVIEHLLPTVDGSIVIVGNQVNVAEIRSLAKSIKVFQNDRISVTADEVDGRGPLEGIRVGLKELQPSCHWAFVTCCDSPLLKPDFIGFLAYDLEDTKSQAFIPVSYEREVERIYGMSAIYRTAPEILSTIDSLIERMQLRVSGLSQAIDSCEISVDDLRSVDANLDSLLNVNDAEQYFSFLDRHGETCPADIASLLRSN